MKAHTCCFTGHRRIPPQHRTLVVERLSQRVEELIDDGYCYFGTGGALGFDTLAALCVLEAKQIHPHIKLILVLPCVTQTRGWSEQDRTVYEHIKSRADKVVYTSKGYFEGCMQRRNRHLVDHSSACVAYCVKSTGGTAYTVSYALRKGIPVLYIP